MPEVANTPSASERFGEQIGSLAQRVADSRQSLGSEGSVELENAASQLSRLPKPGSEAWKYSPVNRLYDALTADAAPLAPSTGEDAADLLSRIDTDRYPLALAAALALKSVSRTTATQGQQIELPACGTGFHWQHIEVPANTQATLIQRKSDANGCALITTIALADGASISHSLSGTPAAGVQWHLLSIDQQKSSSYTLHQLSLGGQLERVDTHVRLLGEGAEASLTGALLCGDSERCDNQTVLEHAAPRCASNARYHGLANHKGKLTFGGRIHILETGAGTDARLHNPNLLLSDHAEINTKPELEIYNDDVACAHGATVGQLDEDAIFYLRSRGINRASAHALLLRGFASDVIGGPDSEHALSLTRQRLEAWTL